MLEVESIDQYRKKDWWFFDTNCLSELVTMFNQGERERVHRFIEGKCVLVQIANMAELTKKEALFETIPQALASAAFIGVTATAHPFIRRDLFIHLNMEKINLDPLGLYELTDEFAKGLPKHQGFIDAVTQSDANLQGQYIDRVTRDVESDFLTPVMVYGYAKIALKRFIESILDLEKDHDLPKRIPKNPRTFPSHFTYWSAYRFFYLVDRNVKPQINDFNDLSLTLAAPICERFYTERRLAHVLKQVKGYEMPSERMVITSGLKYDTTKTKREKQVELARYSDVRGRVLQHTNIYTLADMIKQLQS